MYDLKVEKVPRPDYLGRYGKKTVVAVNMKTSKSPPIPMRQMPKRNIPTHIHIEAKFKLF